MLVLHEYIIGLAFLTSSYKSHFHGFTALVTKNQIDFLDIIQDLPFKIGESF
jgi:hypothetical protein